MSLNYSYTYSVILSYILLLDVFFFSVEVLILHPLFLYLEVLAIFLLIGVLFVIGFGWYRHVMRSP